MDEGNGNPRESEDRYRHINSAESQSLIVILSVVCQRQALLTFALVYVILVV